MISIAMLRKSTGLSQKEAADFLNAHVDTIKKWENGKRKPLYDGGADLFDLYYSQEAVADEAIRLIKQKAIEAVGDFELQLPGSPGPHIEDRELFDELSRENGWPCWSAEERVWQTIVAEVGRDVVVVDGPVGKYLRGGVDISGPGGLSPLP